jgi:hyperosmotically inducible periplasmic protein
MHRRFLAFALLVSLAMALTLGACATADPWHDARLESAVKARLVAEKDVNLTRLGVVSRKSIVYLAGDVTSAEERARAEDVARGVDGVQRVVNAVQVRSP